MTTAASGLKLLPGISSLITATNELIRVAASNDRPVFITGEVGTEKALAAKLVHQLSGRSEEPMTKINVSWKLPPDLSQYFERCSGGTLIIHLQREFPVDMQYTLVEMTNHGCFADPMSGEMVESDARVILIANQELSEMTERIPLLPELRDLLDSQHIEIPPIRSRTEDIPALVRYAIRRARDTGRSQANSVDPGVLVIFRQWDWPGNTEDLLLVTAQAAIKARGETVTIEDLPTSFIQSVPESLVAQARAISGNSDTQESTERSTGEVPLPSEAELSDEDIRSADTQMMRVRRPSEPVPKGEPRRYGQQPNAPKEQPPGKKEPFRDPDLVPEIEVDIQKEAPLTDEDTQRIKIEGENLSERGKAMSLRVLKLARRLNAQTSLLQQQFSGPLDEGANKDLLTRLMNEVDDEEAMKTLESELDRGLDLVLMLRRQMAMLNHRQQQNAETMRDLLARLSSLSDTGGPIDPEVGIETQELTDSLKAIDKIIKRVSDELPTVGKQIESTLLGTAQKKEQTTSGLFRKPQFSEAGENEKKNAEEDESG